MALNKSEALNAAKQHVLQRNVPAAIDTYRKIIVADPTDLAAVDALGDLYASTGRVQEAIEEFTRLAASYSEGGFTRKAITILKKIITLDPGNTETAIKLAGLYAQAGLPSEARQHYLQIAEALARKGERLKALRIYRKIVDLDPSNISTRIKLAELCLREGMNEQAYEAFVSAAEQLAKRGENRRALNAYNEALAVRPDSAEALAATRKLMLSLGLEPDRGLGSSASEGVDLVKEPSTSPVVLDRPHATPVDKPQQSAASSFVVQEISKAEILVAYGQVNQAVAMLRQVLKDKPDSLDVHIKLKDIFLRTGMTNEAATECRELERIHGARGEVERARDYAVRASRLTQLIEQPSGGLKEPERKQPETSDSGRTVAPLRRETTQDPAPKRRPVASTPDTPREPSRIPITVIPVESPAVPVTPASERSSPRPDSKPSFPLPVEEPLGDKASRHSALVTVSDPPAEAALAPAPEPLAPGSAAIAPMPAVAEPRVGNEVSREVGLAVVTRPAGEVGARALPTLFTAKLPVSKKRARLTATATAAGGFVILAVSAAIAGFAYDAQLNKQYQALASAAPPFAAPSPPPPPAFEEPAPDQAAEPMTVVVNSPAQSDASDQRQNREPSQSQINNGSPSTPQASSVPRKEMTPSPSPVPPRVGISPDNRMSNENQIPLGVPADVPIGPTHPAEPPPKIVRRSPGVVVGSAVKRVDPVYPTAAKEARQSGVVVVEVTISEQGSVTSTRAVSGPAILRNAAVAAARGWKFKPSTLGGVPVTTTTTLVFNFKL